MRGEDQRAASFFSYVSLEQRIPADHPLRPIRELVDEALRSLSPAFNKLYARYGRQRSVILAACSHWIRESAPPGVLVNFVFNQDVSS